MLLLWIRAWAWIYTNNFKSGRRRNEKNGQNQFGITVLAREKKKRNGVDLWAEERLVCAKGCHMLDLIVPVQQCVRVNAR